MSGDRCTEKGGSGGGGTVSEAMNKDQCLGFRQLWDIKIPPRALSFAWRLLWDRLPSKENLSRRQVEIDNDLCPFCQSKSESASYLFFTCAKDSSSSDIVVSGLLSLNLT